MLLAIDTSAGTSVAVVDRDAGVLAELSENDTRRHAEVIGTMIEACLRDAGIAVTDLSGVAVGMGPGPFTGLRVGIAAARAFAFGAGKHVVPVVSHDAIAFDLLARGSGDPLLVVTDARRREVYWSAYSGLDARGLPVRALGPGLVKPADIADAVDADSAAGAGFATYARADVEFVSAGAVGMLAETLFVNKRPFATSEALYLRSPEIYASTGPKRVS